MDSNKDNPANPDASEGPDREQRTENSLPHSGSLSRRQFVKSIGAATLGALIGNVAVPPSISKAVAADSVDINRARAIAEESPLLKQALAELKSKGFAFDLSQSGFSRASSRPDFSKYTELVGLSFASIETAPSRTVADIMATVDLKSQGLTSLTYSVVRSTDEALEVSEVLLQSDGQRRESEKSSPRKGAIVHRGPVVHPITAVMSSPPAPSRNPDDPEWCEEFYYTECTQWYVDHCYTYAWCCCGPQPWFCWPQYVCECRWEYRNCRECRYGLDCNTYCQDWYSEWRNLCVICRGHGCW